MTGGVRVEVEGDTALAASLAKASNDLGHMDRAHTAAGQVVKQRATGNAPVDTGALVRSIRADAAADGVTVSAGAPYAPYVEYGTTHTPAQPFLGPAVEDATAEVGAIYLAEVEDVLAKVEGA